MKKTKDLRNHGCSRYLLNDLRKDIGLGCNIRSDNIYFNRTYIICNYFSMFNDSIGFINNLKTNRIHLLRYRCTEDQLA